MSKPVIYGHMDRCHLCKSTGKYKGHKCVVCDGDGYVVAAKYQCLCVCGCIKYTLMMICDDCMKTCKSA